MPCFNHGRFIEQAVESVRDQTYPNVEIICVDDGSTEPETQELMERLEVDTGVVVERLERNSGPAVARNRGIGLARGRYILPVDSDNQLLPRAIEKLVEQLEEADSSIGFIYPNMLFFGNRHDRWEAPPYNLYLLLEGNYCDTCSLFDRGIFDLGIRYPEGVFREDWHFVLTLGKRGIFGQPARTDTLRFRKRGFNRSDLVGHAKSGPELDEQVRAEHPELYGTARTTARIKARWLPAVSVIFLDALSADTAVREDLRRALDAQTCVDAEVLVFSDVALLDGDGPFGRALPVAPGQDPGLALGVALEAARGRHVVVISGEAPGPLSSCDFVEKFLRTIGGRVELGAIGFADGGDDAHPWRLIFHGELIDVAPHAVGWARDRVGNLDEPIRLVEGNPILSLAIGISHRTSLQWRHLRRDQGEGCAVTAPMDIHLPALSPTTVSQSAAPLLPNAWSKRPRRRWLHWLPPQSQPLFRFVDRQTGRRVISLNAGAPPGYQLEQRLGTVKNRPVPGTTRAEVEGEPSSPDVEFAITPEEDPVPRGRRVLGYVEMAALPMLVGLKVARVRATGQRTLVLGKGDPLLGGVEVTGHLGYIEPSPIHPSQAPHADLALGVTGIVRCVDLKAGRHVYGVGTVPDGELVGELGALHHIPSDTSIPVYLTPDQHIRVEGDDADSVPAAEGSAARWVLSSLKWRGFSRRERWKQAVQRAYRLPAVKRARAAATEANDVLVGYLYASDAPKRVPLYSAEHPVTGDQLLTRWPREAESIGYYQVRRLGYLVRYAPTLRQPFEKPFHDVEIPWAFRLGRPARGNRR